MTSGRTGSMSASSLAAWGYRPPLVMPAEVLKAVEQDTRAFSLFADELERAEYLVWMQNAGR